MLCFLFFLGKAAEVQVGGLLEWVQVLESCRWVFRVTNCRRKSWTPILLHSFSVLKVSLYAGFLFFPNRDLNAKQNEVRALCFGRL